MESNDQDPKLQARIAELMKLTKPALKDLAKNTYRPGFKRDDPLAKLWNILGSGASKWELAYHIARIEIQGH